MVNSTSRHSRYVERRTPYADPQDTGLNVGRGKHRAAAAAAAAAEAEQAAGAAAAGAAAAAGKRSGQAAEEVQGVGLGPSSRCFNCDSGHHSQKMI